MNYTSTVSLRIDTSFIAALTSTAADLRVLFNLPDEIPEKTLNLHLAGALRQLHRDTGIAVGSDHVLMQSQEWQEALLTFAYANVLPHLNSFYMQGVAKADRLASLPEARFLAPDEIAGQREILMRRYRQLVQQIQDDLTSDQRELGIYMAAI